MNNYKLKKVLSKVAIILLIAVFGIVGFISCKKKVTQPEYQQTIEIPNPTNTGPVTPDPGDTNVTPDPGDTNVTPDPGDTNVTPDPEPTPEPEPVFPEDTYRRIYTPWRGDNYPTVSYQDTNKLLQYWKEMISRKDTGNTKRWMIRTDKDGYNFYYFDKNFDLVYYREGKGTLKIRKLVGATIMKYYRGNYKGTLSIAGIYENLVDKAGQYGWQHFSKFMHAGYNGENNNDYRKVGDLELMLLNIGFQNPAFTQFGVDSYYGTWNDYRRDINKFLGQSPESLESSSGGRLNVNQRVNLAYNPEGYSVWFIESTPGNWEAEEHPDTGWVQR